MGEEEQITDCLSLPIPSRGNTHTSQYNTHEHGRLVRQYVTEDVARHHHVELLRPTDELHSSVVHVLMRQLHLREFGAHLRHDVPPKLHSETVL